MWSLLAHGATFMALWFLIGSAFLLLWAGLAWVGRRAMTWAEKELHDQDEYRQHTTSPLDSAWCPHCGRLDGSHAPDCEHEWFLARHHRLVKR